MEETRSRFCKVSKKYRLSEFLVSLVMMACGTLLHINSAVKRDIPRVVVPISQDQTVYARDPSIDLKMMPEQVPMWLLVILAYFLPAACHCLIIIGSKLDRFRRIPHDTRDFFLSLLISAGFSFIVTTFVKNITGRFRPSFYSMCEWDYSKTWDGVANLCTSSMEVEARKSFPSGHSSAAFSGLFLLSLYLLGRSRLVVEDRAECQLRSGKRLMKLFLCFGPTLLAAWIAITRSIDNWHHYTDVLAGSLIGMAAATIGYMYNYGGVFCSRSAGFPLEVYHARQRKSPHLPEDKYDLEEAGSVTSLSEIEGRVDDSMTPRSKSSDYFTSETPTTTASSTSSTL